MRPDEIERMYRLEHTYWWFAARRALVRDLLVRAGVPRGGRVLDAGCGTGGTFEALKDWWQVVGLDISSLALPLARQRGMTAGVVGRVEAIPLADGVFDAVVSCDVLEHLEEDVGALAELLRVTRPGGALVLTVPALPSLWSDHDEALEHLRRYTKAELAAKLRKAGWQVERLNYTVSLLLPPIAGFRLFRRLRRSHGAPRVDLFELPGPINAVLEVIAQVDRWLAARVPLPPGASLLAVARRPEETDTRTPDNQ
ncbi:MAG: class I SAM-dependent methyltransferase [Armatimonadetes bacterium]|nr:class I SAM-dependent methyltransferase [Armatimonadota bacterium]